MGDTFSIFKRKSKPQFNIEKKPAVKGSRVRVTGKRRSSSAKKKSTGPLRAKRTLYEDTINIDTSSDFDSAELATSSIDSIRQRQQHKRVTFGVFVAVLVTALVAAVVFFCMIMFFRIENVVCEGVTLYDTEELVTLSGIEPGDHLFLINKGQICESLGYDYPYLKNITIKQKLPSTVVITAEEEEAVYCALIGNRYYILSSTMRILESVEGNEAALKPFGELIELTLPTVSRAVESENVQYFAQSSEEYVNRSLAALMDIPQSEGIRSVDLSSRFDLSFNYEGRVDVLLGRAEDLEAKLRFAFTIMGEFEDTAKGTVSAESVESGYAIMD